MTEQRAKNKEQRAESREHPPNNRRASRAKNRESLDSWFLLLGSEKGIALVMILVLSLISLTIVSAMLYLVTQGTIFSGAHKFFRTAEEAGFGGAEIVSGYVNYRGELDIDKLPGVDFTAGCNCEDPYIYTDNKDLNLMPIAASCRCDKLCNPTANWSALCNEPGAGFVSLDPVSPLTRIDGTDAFDMSFNLGDFTVFTKIVDTVQGNTDVGRIVKSGRLGGEGVAVSNSALVKPPHAPYLYRIEVEAEDTDNPKERSKLSVLYAY